MGDPRTEPCRTPASCTEDKVSDEMHKGMGVCRAASLEAGEGCGVGDQ